MFSTASFEKDSTYPWVYFFAPHLTRQRKFSAAFFSKSRKSCKVTLYDKPWFRLSRKLTEVWPSHLKFFGQLSSSAPPLTGVSSKRWWCAGLWTGARRTPWRSNSPAWPLGTFARWKWRYFQWLPRCRTGLCSKRFLAAIKSKFVLFFTALWLLGAGVLARGWWTREILPFS